MKFNKLLIVFLSFIIFSLAFIPSSSAFAQQNKICTCITSEPAPQPRQSHRSSGNFSTQGCADNLLWTTEPGPVFDVKEDKSLGTDPTIFSSMTTNVIKPNPNKRDLYIANPKNANSNFTVCTINN
jgi:hypothetical protein